MSEQNKQVYWVRLTEEDRAELEHLARQQWAYSTPPNKPHAKRRLDILQSARPENPKRLEAMEELVGRRVRIPHLGLSGCISAKLNPQWQVDFDDGGMDTFFRDDFELLEDA